MLRDGKVEQVAEPQVLYAEPRNLFVAAFIGSPAMNLVEASIEDDAVAFGGFRLPLDARRGARPQTSAASCSASAPRRSRTRALAAAALPRVSVDVEVVEELGAETNAFFRIDAARVAAEAAASEESDASLIAGDTQLFTARLDPRSRVRGAGRVDLAVDPARFHFFDPASGVGAPAERRCSRRQRTRSGITGIDH